MKLYEPIKIGEIELKNRLVMVPAGDSFHDRGWVTQRQCDFWARRAQGGVGLIITSYAAIDSIHRVDHNVRIDDDRFIKGLVKLASAIKENGARAGIQLVHQGMRFSSNYSGMQPIGPSQGHCFSPWALSTESARAMSTGEIQTVIGKYAESARRAKEAGFDVVEIQGAHGALPGQFMSLLSNHRSDKYGGGVEDRSRFAVEIVRAIRDKVGKELVISFRISADEHVDGGLTHKDTKVISSLLENAGVDMLSISGGHNLSMHWVMPSMLMPKFTHFTSSSEIKGIVGIPVLGVGRVQDPREAERLLAQGKADLIGVGRALLADPDFAIKGLEGRYKEINKCLDCNYVCVPTLINARQTAACLVNPEVGAEQTRETKADRPKRIVICGAGPAGLEAARVAKIRGHDVTLLESNKNVGGRWSFLIRPYVTRQLRILRGIGVKILLGRKPNVRSVLKFKPDTVLVTDSAVPLRTISGTRRIKGMTVDEALDSGDWLGDKVVIIGGGNYGCETAYILRTKQRSADIAIIERGSQVGYGLPALIQVSLIEKLVKLGVRFITNTEVVNLREGKVTIADNTGKRETLKANNVVLAIGSETNKNLLESLKDKVAELISLPYCDQPRNIPLAIEEGRDIARST
ncbi:FAD-dependent oxidoreductase [Chloroflexota bacterium]